MKIELKHLAPYLPYKLKCQYIGIINGKELSIQDKEYKKDGLPFDFNIQPITGLKTGILKEILIFKDYWRAYIGNYGRALKSFHNGFDFKPVLRPISDLYNTSGFSVSELITHGYHNQFWSKEKFSVKHIYYHDLLILLKHHFDVFGLIEKGLAIDINTLKK